MPPSWPDDEGMGDDDAPLGAPVHPDDRLWRHPSEMAWGVAPSAAMTTPPFGTPSVRPRPQARTWVVAVASGLTGAALAIGLVVLVAGVGTSGPNRVVERIGVQDRLPDPMLTDAADTTAGIVAIAQAVIPSVVRLEVGTGRGTTTTGSGVVVLDDGHILTNAHVVDDARTITIVQADGTAVAGQLVGTDALTDIAVVAPAEHAAHIHWIPAVRGPAADLTTGEPVLTVGSPQGLAGAPSVTLGVISGVDRRVRTLHGMLQTDAPVADGSSGGALCDRAGRVVGITTSAFAAEAPTSGFATPMETAWPVAEALMADGAVHHVWLGIEGADIRATRTSLMGITGTVGGGVVVDRVLAGSPAEEADLRAGDVLLSVDGAPLSSMSDLVLTLRGYEPGDDITLGVERGGRRGQVDVTLSERDG